MKLLTISRVLGLSLIFLATNGAFAQSLSQWNVNNSGSWYNALNWLNYNPANGAGANVAINQDFSPGRGIGEVVQTATMTTGAGTGPQTPVTLSFTPVDGTIGVSDGTLFWGQGRGSSSTLWTVTYDAGPKQINVTYNPALTGNRTLTITYGTTEARPFADMIGFTERVGLTNGSTLTFSKSMVQLPAPNAIGVTDGTFWYHFGTQTGNNPNFTATYDPGTRTVTVNYSSSIFAPAGRTIYAAYAPAGMSGTFGVSVGTIASGQPIRFTRQMTAAPTLASSFAITDGSNSGQSNGSGVFSSSSPGNFSITYTDASRTAVVTYQTLAGLNSLGAGRTLTAGYMPSSPTAQNVTLGNMLIGDISGGDRVDIRLGSLTLDNNNVQAQINKIIGGPDEIASPIILNDDLALAVRTGGDVINNNSFYISGNISGDANITKMDSGNLVLGGNNSYTGSTTIRSTGGFTFLKSNGTAIPSADVVLGNASRDGHTAMVIQYGINSLATLGTATTTNTNQIADNAVIFFDAASSRNSYIRMMGVGETVAGIQDSTSNGVIENTEGEAGVLANSVLTLNSNNNYSYNGYFRNKSSGASSGTIGLVKEGTGTQTLAGGNISYTGPTTIGGGTLRLLNITGAGTMPFNPQSVTGTFNGNNAPRFDSVVTNNANLELAATTVWTYGTTIQGPGTVTKTGASNVNITGLNTYTGATTISEGALILMSGPIGFVKNANNDFVLAADNNAALTGNRMQAIYGHGRLQNTSAITLNGAGLIGAPAGGTGTLFIQNNQDRTYKAPGVPATGPDSIAVYNFGDRVNDAAPISSDGGVVNFNHTYVDTLAKVNYSETLGQLNLQAGRTLITTSQAPEDATSVLGLSGIARSGPGATVVFNGLELGDNARNRVDLTPGATPAPTLVNGILGGWAVTTANNTANNIEVNFATWDAAKDSVRALQNYTVVGDIDPASVGIGANVSLTGTETMTTNKTINSLKFPGGRTLNLGSGNTPILRKTLTLESGGLIVALGNSVINNGFITAGASSGYEVNVYTQVDRVLTMETGKFDDNAGIPVKLVKSGQGLLRMNSNSTHTGGTIINEGNIEVKNDSALGIVPGNIYKSDFLTLNGGTLSGQVGTGGASLTITLETYQGITLGSGGGGFQGDVGLTFKIRSKITGPGGLTMNPLTNLEGGSNGGLLELLGDNDFQGSLNINLGEISLGGYEAGIKKGSNTFGGSITIGGGTLSVKNSAAVPASKPAVNMTGGNFNLYDNASIGALTGSGAGTTITSVGSSDSAYVFKPIVLTITQDVNTTFAGNIVNINPSNLPTTEPFAPSLSLDKRGKGTLTLGGIANDYDGFTKVSEGTLLVTAMTFRGRGEQGANSLGTGEFDASVLDGTGILSTAQKSASNLVIMDGAAFGTVGDFQLSTDRPFTIGVGQQGVTLLANAGTTGNAVAWRQNKLYYAFDHPTMPGEWTGGYDDIQFTEANKNALFILGGRNQGGNQFGMDLHDNGTGKLSLQKSGDGNWILGEWGKQTGVLVETPSRNDFTGRTNIYLGTLGIAQDHVLGAAGGESVNLIGGNLDLINVKYTTPEDLSMAGGRLRAFVGESSWAGNVSVNVGSAIETGPGAVIRLLGNVSGKGGVTKVGFGTLTLEGNNTFTGGFTIQEGTLRLDYTNNTGSKLFDSGGFVMGGGREGGTLDIVGGTSGTPIVEVVAALNLGLGQSRITRSDGDSTTVVLLNALENGRLAQGSALDIGADNIVRTDRLNDSAGGLLGTWMTINKRDWATNATNAPDGSIVAVTNYTADNWAGAATNTTVTLPNNTINSGITNTLRFNEALDTVLTLTGINSIRSDGIIQTPEVGTNYNVIKGGSISIQDNGFGGNMMIHQNNPLGSLTIDSALTNATLPSSVSGDMYVGSLANRMTVNPPSDAARLVPGMLITGVNIEPNTTITAIDYNTGDLTLNQGRTAQTNITLTIAGSSAFTGDTLVQGVLNRVRVRTGNMASIVNGQSISGGIIPGGSTVTSVAVDFTNTDYRLLTISQNMAVPSVINNFTITPILTVTGQMYFNAQINRYRITPISGVANLYVGMAVSGDQLDANTVISSIDFFNGDIFLTPGRNANVGIPLTIQLPLQPPPNAEGKPEGPTVYTGDTMIGNTQNRVRVTGTPLELLTIVTGIGISGGTIPANTTITAIAYDNVVTPTVATLTISQNIPIPAIISNFNLTMSSRNGVAKFGEGTLVMGGESTYTGATYITGGKLNTKKLTNGGVASPIGAASNAAGNIVLSGGTLGYIGDSVTTDRGFQINEVGGIEVARKGAVATFTGNLSGGVGGANGVLEKSGQGTLNISRIGGSVLPGTPVGSGGATNIGGVTVEGGTLQLSYDNPNSNENSNRFAASNATVTLAGGKLELVGLDDTLLPEGTSTSIANPSENRTQQFLGALTLEAGASQIWVTSGINTVTTLDLQNPSDTRDVIRKAGATVLLVENPNGGTANMTLAIPASATSTVIPWATFWDTSQTDIRGINDFAAVELLDNGVINADSKAIYAIQPDVGSWKTGDVVSEGASNTGFSGFTDDTFKDIFAIRFRARGEGIVNITDTLTLSGGAILVGAGVVDNHKVIQGGTLTSTFHSGPAGIPTPVGLVFGNSFDQEVVQYDLMIHNYNPGNTLDIKSTIANTDVRGLFLSGDPYLEPVNVVQTGVGTTVLSGNNTYSGRTMITGGVLQLGSAGALPGGMGVTGGTSNVTLKGGMLGLNGDFLRPLGTTGADVQFTGSGGFAAYGGDRTVNLGGAGAEVAWGVGGFVPAGEGLLLNNVDADGLVRFMNPIDLGSGYRQITVGDSTAAVDAELAGAIKGNGGYLAKVGQGTLRMTASNSYTGGTDVAQGKLILQGSQASPISISAVDASQIGDAVTLQLDGATVSSAVTVGNKNSQGTTTLKVTNNSTFAGSVDILRNTFIDVATGRAVAISGAVGGSGRITVDEGGTVNFNGVGTFGSSGGVQGEQIDGGLVLRSGTVNVGASGGIGNTNVELGDSVRLVSGLLVDRSTVGRSVLQKSGDFIATSNGVPGSVNGLGAFVYQNQFTLTIDGRTYGQNDVGTRILVDGEADHPERNGVYEFIYILRDLDGDLEADLDPEDDVISLVRVDSLNEADEQIYGTRVTVLNGSAAGKKFLLATDVPNPLPAPNGSGHRIINTAILWKEELSVNPNVSLLASAAGVNLTNTIDINSTNGTGTTTLGGAAALVSGSSSFGGNVKLQNLAVDTVETRQLRITSETLTGHGIEFGGVFSEVAVEDTLSLNKVGAGTATLSGLNTYKGATTVTAGTLLVNGGTLFDALNGFGSGTGFGNVTVSNFGSALGGVGTIGGNVIVGDGALVSPGDPLNNSGIGALNFAGDLLLGAGSVTEFHLLQDLAYDQLVGVGTLTVDPAALLSVFLDYVPSSALDFQLLNWGSISALGNLADRLDLPAIASSAFYWDTSLFSTLGTIRYAERLATSLPPVHFATKDTRMAEAGGSFKIAVELDWEPTGSVSVPLVFSGTAIQGVDYTVSENPVVLGSARSKTITVTVNNDAIAEGTEKAVISIGSPTGAILGTPASFNLTISDDDNGFVAGDEWILRNPLPTNETLNGTAFVSSTYVAVGTKGTLLTSVDGSAWTRVVNASSNAIQDVTSDGSVAVAVGDGGQILTTTDGLSWTIRSASGGKDLKGVIANAGVFVAVGSGGASYVSTNGESWDFVATPAAADLHDVATSATKMIAVGSSGTIISSLDNGLTWAPEVSGIVTTLRSVAYDGTGIFVATGDGGVILTSPDGSTWTPRTSGTSNQLRSVTWDGSKFLAAGSSGVLLSSAAGTTWAPVTSTVTADLHSVAKVNALWLATGEAGMIISSTNGTTWARISTHPVHNNYGVTMAGTTVIAVGEGGKILTSPDGTVWTQQTSPIATRLNAVAGSDSNMVAVGHAGAAVHSTDGTIWSSVPTGSAQNLYGVARMNTLFVAVGDGGTVFTTNNGTTWTERTSGSSTTENLRAVTATADKFVAVGVNGTVITSPDGVAWTPQSLGTTTTLHDVTSTSSGLVAVGVGGAIFTSTDGIDWVPASSSTGSDLNGVAGVGAEVIAVGGSGVALYSSNSGATWSKRETGTSQGLRSIAVNAAQRYIAVGINGTILTSDTIVKPSPKVSFTLANQTVTEAAGVVNVQVNVSPAATALVTVPFTVSAGSTAKAPGDYTIVATALKFAPGETVKNIPITVKADAVLESMEFITLNLGTPSGGTTTTTAPTSFTLNITDEYAQPTITPVGGAGFVIAGQPFSVTATATGSNPLKIQWQKGTTNLGTPVVVTSGVQASYTVASATIANGGKYNAKAINPLKPSGVAAASGAEIVVVERLSQQLKLGKENSPVALVANAGGTGLIYRWYRDNVLIASTDPLFSGTTTKTLTIKKMSDALEGIYKCLVVSSAVAGAEFGTEFKVRKASIPQITGAPSSLTLPNGRVGSPYNVTGFPVPFFNDSEGRFTPASWTATKLPLGLTINSSGLISGTPIVAITAQTVYSNIVITATNVAGKSVSAVTSITIDPIPGNAVGIFVGMVDRSGGNSLTAGTNGLGARFDLTTMTNSTFSGKISVGATAYPFNGGKLNTSTPATPTGTITVARKGKTSLQVTFAIDTATNLLTGTVTDTTPTSAAINGWRQVWKTTNPNPNPVVDRLGRHNFMAAIPLALEGDSTPEGASIPQGDSFGSATVAANGVVTITYKTSENSLPTTASSTMSPTGKFLLYRALYTATAPGSVMGTLVIANTASVHEVTGNLTWNKYPQLASVKLYQAGFGPITLDVEGGLYTPPTVLGTDVILGAKVAAGPNAKITFFDSSALSLSGTAINPNLPSFRINSLATFVVPVPNPAAVTMKFVSGTGEFSGTFIVKDPPVADRKVSYFGLVIPDTSTPAVKDGVGAGYFILNGTTSALPQKSGRVTLIPLP